MWGQLSHRTGCPGGLCWLHLGGFFLPDWMKHRTAWSDLRADPVLSRRLDLVTFWGPSVLEFSCDPIRLWAALQGEETNLPASTSCASSWLPAVDISWPESISLQCGDIEPQPLLSTQQKSHWSHHCEWMVSHQHWGLSLKGPNLSRIFSFCRSGKMLTGIAEHVVLYHWHGGIDQLIAWVHVLHLFQALD